MRNTTTYAILILALLLSYGLRAQMKVKVITKTIDQSYPLLPGETLHVQGEKSNMTIHTWKENKVKIQLKLIAKAKDLATATRELEYQKHIIEKRKQAVYLKNYFLVPKGKTLNAILQAEYELWMPANAALKIENNYGNVNLEDKSGDTQIDFRYGTLSMNAISGTCAIKGYFGDLVIDELYGRLTARLKHTKSLINKVKGKANFNTSLGDVTVVEVDRKAELKIEASKSDVDMQNLRPEIHQLKLRSEYGEILIPEDFPGKIDYVSGDLNVLDLGDQSQPLIEVKTTFGNIILSLK